MSQPTDAVIAATIDATENLQPGSSTGESMLIVGDETPPQATNAADGSDGPMASLQSCISEIQEELLEQHTSSAIGDAASPTPAAPASGAIAAATPTLPSDLATGTLRPPGGGDDDDTDIDYLHNADWLAQSDHVFVLNTSGKPIYTLHGCEDKLATIFGVMQALVSVVASNDGDAIESVQAAGVQIVFLVKAPLVLVAVSKSQLSVHQMQMELTCVPAG